ncbi:ImmA/IrrE family metallo-endopeptidase [Thermodesulfobacteriota bacterium]
MKVPFLPKKKIVDIAENVFSEYQAMVGHDVNPPIPVEDILERYLGVTLCFHDFKEKHGMEGVLGATYVKKQLICADTKLLDDPSEGRLNFTWAHEAGHWVMHRKLVNNASNTILCRYKDAKLPVEWQADYFASCLLMPEKKVKEAWDKTYGPDPLVIFNVRSALKGPVYFDPSASNWHLIADRVCEAGGFSNVSKQAMIIKLQNLGLVKNTTGARMGWAKVFFENLNPA